MPTTLPVRLSPGQDLRQALEAAVAAERCQAAFVLGGIGSLSHAEIRYAGATASRSVTGDLEILTLSGTIASNGSHLHASLADAHGRVSGGHVALGCIVRTTAEVLIALLDDDDWHFSREHDEATGYAELVPRRRSIPR